MGVDPTVRLTKEEEVGKGRVRGGRSMDNG